MANDKHVFVRHFKPGEFENFIGGLKKLIEMFGGNTTITEAYDKLKETDSPKPTTWTCCGGIDLPLDKRCQCGDRYED